MTTNTIQHTKPSEAVAFRFPFSNFITVKRDHFAMLWPCIENENVNFVTFHNFAFNRQKNTKSRPSHSKGSQLNIYLSTSKFISRCNLVWMLLFHHHCRHRHQHHSKSNSSQLFRKKNERFAYFYRMCTMHSSAFWVEAGLGCKSGHIVHADDWRIDRGRNILCVMLCCGAPACPHDCMYRA